jgi:nicotinamidase-related amidase
MKTALILVDIQNDYFPGGANALWEQEAAAKKALDVLQLFRENSLPVVHIRHINTRAGATFFLPGTPGSEIHDSVRPAGGETVIIKNFPDSFLKTTLQEHLEGVGADRLVVCGMMSHMCIDTTVRSAAARGYAVILPHDACATRDLPWDGGTIPAGTVHNTFMAALRGTFATVVATNEVEALLRKDMQ